MKDSGFSFKYNNLSRLRKLQITSSYKRVIQFCVPDQRTHPNTDRKRGKVKSIKPLQHKNLVISCAASAFVFLNRQFH